MKNKASPELRENYNSLLPLHATCHVYAFLKIFLLYMCSEKEKISCMAWKCARSTWNLMKEFNWIWYERELIEFSRSKGVCAWYSRWHEAEQSSARVQWLQLYNSDVESGFLIWLVIWNNWPLSGTQIIPTLSLSDITGLYTCCLVAE